MPFLRERSERLGKQSERADLQRRFAAPRYKTCPLRANEIADVQQAKKLDQFRANLFCMDVNLNAPCDVTQIEKVAFPHVAVRGDAAGDTKRFTLLKLVPHLRDRAAHFKAGAKRFDAFRAQRVKF